MVHAPQDIGNIRDFTTLLKYLLTVAVEKGAILAARKGPSDGYAMANRQRSARRYRPDPFL